MIDRWTLLFYRAMLWFMNYELTIACSTGRNPESVKQLRLDVAKLGGYVDRLEVQ